MPVRLLATQLHRCAMTPHELNATLDALIAAAGYDPNGLPALIEISSAEWCEALYAIEHSAKSLDEGIRHRGIKVAISSAFDTRVMTRADAGERGAPYRDLEPRA